MAKSSIDYADLAANYGFALAVLNSNPELKKIFQQAVAPKNDWSTARFQAAVMNTTWYKTQSADTRQWLILQETDPATAKARVAARTTTITNAAGALGVKLSAQQLKDITSQSLLLGWTDAQVQGAISKDWNYNPSTAQAGLAGQTLDKINAAAAAYLLPLSDTTKNQWVQHVLSGLGTAEDFTEYAKQQAKSQFSWMAPQIDQGITVQQYLDPYRQQAAQLLGVGPDSIDFMDPKWRGLVETVDSKTAQRAPMTLADATTKMRTDPIYGFDQSQVGRQQGAQLVTQLASMFGNI
jgi:hypothetical protein